MKKIYFIIFSISLISNCFAQKADPILREINTIENSLIKNIQIKGDSIQKFNILERMEYYKVPGVSIAIVENGKIKWAKGYGYANSETKLKIDTTTLFQAGSISKPVAALGVLKLVEEGKVNLDSNVNTYLKDWKVQENAFTVKEKVTLRRLLSHTAGVTVQGFPGYRQNKEVPSIQTVLNGNGNTPRIQVNIVPGTKWRYSGGGYTIIEKLIEDISGLPFEEYMKENILNPLGMNNSTYEQPLPRKLHASASSAFNRKGKMIKGLWHNYPEQAAAGLWTTPSDLVKYCIEIQDILSGKESGILSKETVNMMLTKQKNNWGLGPSLELNDTILIFSHGGKNTGFTNNMYGYAYSGKALVVMTNGDKGWDLIQEIQRSITMFYNW